MPCHGLTAGGWVIANLQVGDLVLIKAGAGMPPQEEDITDIIADVQGMSAITAKGMRLKCTDGYFVQKTGEHFEPGTFEVSPEAQRIINEANAERN